MLVIKGYKIKFDLELTVYTKNFSIVRIVIIITHICIILGGYQNIFTFIIKFAQQYISLRWEWFYQFEGKETEAQRSYPRLK